MAGTRVGFGAFLIGALVLNHQSTIQSAIAKSTIESAIRNPHSAMTTPWRALFDGSSLNAWRGYKSASVPDGWRIADGTLAKDGHAGDLITKDQFGDFELELEWRIGRAGNGGIVFSGI